MAILAFAGDESADGKMEHVLSAGGFIAKPSDFFEAERLWQARLDADSIAYFHATDCQNLNKEFHKFRAIGTLDQARARANGIKDDLIAIINKSQAILGVSVSLVIPDFNEVISTNAKALKHYGNDPAILTYRRLIVAVLELIANDLGTGYSIAFEFDDHSHWERAERAYEELRGSAHDPHNMLGHIGHGDDKKIPALQMADLMAYEARYAAELWLAGRSLDRPTFKALSDDPNHTVAYMGIMTREKLLASLDEIPDDAIGSEAIRWQRD